MESLGYQMKCKYYEGTLNLRCRFLKVCKHCNSHYCIKANTLLTPFQLSTLKCSIAIKARKLMNEYKAKEKILAEFLNLKMD